MQCSGVVTMTTDFGHKGPFAAVMRGVILSRTPTANVVDLAHDIPPQWPPEAGFWISRAYSYFPPGTIHMGIVDPGVGTERDILIAVCDGHIFLAPDNGLLAELLDKTDQPQVFRLDLARLTAIDITAVSETFHGRDIFAPIAAELAAGRLDVSSIGDRVSEWTPGWLAEPEESANKISGTIITIDTFGNLISNIDAAMIDTFREPVISIAGQQLAMLSTYGRAKPGELLALINSFGVIEIAKSEGNAAATMGIDRGAPVVVRDGFNS